MKHCKTCMELEWTCETEKGNGYRCKKCRRGFVAKSCSFRIAVLNTTKEEDE